jgi:hypothetical protein
MSNPYGVAPPPPPRVFEPRSGSQPAATVQTTKMTRSAAKRMTKKRRVPRPPDPHRWRRRAALLLAFLAGAALLGANLATWADRAILDPRSAASTSAPAAFDATAAALVPTAVEQTTVYLETTARVRLAPTDTEQLAFVLGEDTSTRVANAVNVAVYGEQFRQQWAAAVDAAWQNQNSGVDSGTVDDRIERGVTVAVPLEGLGEAINTELINEGYPFLAGGELVLEGSDVTLVGPALDNRPVLAFADSYWWLLILLTVALGIGAVLVARDRLRMGQVLAIDAVFVLVGCLVLVPLVRQVADDPGQTPAEDELLIEVYNALTRGLVTQTLVLITLAVVTAIVLSLLGRRRRERGRSEEPTVAA